MALGQSYVRPAKRAAPARARLEALLAARPRGGRHRQRRRLAATQLLDHDLSGTGKGALRELVEVGLQQGRVAAVRDAGPINDVAVAALRPRLATMRFERSLESTE